MIVEAMTALALEFENVTKLFTADKKVVDNLSFSVKEGEFFSILGPSGCGKTTCLRMISGLEKPSTGVIRMNGKVVNDVHPHKRNVHMVFQKYALFPHLNVFDNVAFGLRMKKRPEREIRDRVTRMLKMVSMEDYAKRSIQQLSGGEQQRVALVRSLVNEPAILLLDEPLGALDLKLREQMQQELATIQKQLGTTFIFVTHDQWEALTLSDRIAIMNRGKIEQIGTPAEVYEQPTTAFVSRFVGTTNLFKGRLIAASNGMCSIQTEEAGLLHTRLEDGKLPPPEGAAVGLVVRPEKIRIRVTSPSHSSTAASAPTNGGVLIEVGSGAAITAAPLVAIAPQPSINVLRGTLLERTYFGATTQVRLKITDQLPPLIALLANQAAAKMPALKIGERYYAVWDAADSVLVQDA